jgi:hypothetical protein
VKPAFLITIDTEADNEWECRERPTTKNASFLPRFQNLCERYGLRPTWLVNHDMATDPTFVSFGHDVLARDAGEIGMHLHAWRSPPMDVSITENDAKHATYLIEYPGDTIRAKVAYMTRLLRETFETEITSHRAGRWALDEVYAHALADCGYTVDCSVTPGISWRGCPGAPSGQGGSDYTGFPHAPYFMDLDEISRPGNSQLLQVPMTIHHVVSPALLSLFAAPDRVRHKLSTWLMPVGTRRDKCRKALEKSLARSDQVLMFAIHSSELMPGGSPTFRDEAAIEDLYVELDRLFQMAAETCIPMTLREYREQVATDRPSAGHLARHARPEGRPLSP